jgi:signal transduction histidine kinase/HAMP domain-containing protein
MRASQESVVLIKQSLRAGLIAGMAMAILAFIIFSFWEQLRIVWPVAFVPLFATGTYAVKLAGRAVSTAGRAALAGALAGLVAGGMSTLAVALLSILIPVLGGPSRSDTPLWALHSVLLDSPFFLPPSVIYWDLPGLLPFPWAFSRMASPGVQVSRIPWPLLIFVPLGALLSALQSWLYYLLVRQAKVGLRSVDRLARIQAGFQAKLLAGFVILGAMIFAVGWLGWAATEEMHFQVHNGRTMHHWLDHALRVQGLVRSQTEALTRLHGTPNDAALQEVSALGQMITAELTHLKAVPPPAHPAESTGAIGRRLREEAQKRQPAAQEADSRYAELNQATGRVVEFYRAGNVAETQALLTSLDPQRRVVEATLQQLVDDLNADLGQWAAEADRVSHGEQLATMLLVLAATGVALPLGYVFSQVVVRPVNAVGKGLERIGSGDFSSRVRVENRDELGELAHRVNQTSEQLAGLYEERQTRTRELARSVEEQKALSEISQAVTSTLDLQTVLTTIVSHAVQLSGADAGTIYEFDDAAQAFRLRAAHQMSEELLASIREITIGLDDPVVGQAATTRASVQVPNIREVPTSPLREALGQAGFRAVLVVPLLREERIVGALVVRRRAQGRFDPQTVELLQAFATQSVLAILNARLFQEIEEKGRQLEVASQHKSQFLANMSHELRTPLNAILGYTELVLDSVYGEPPEKIGEVLERVDKSGRHLLGLINDVLDLSKMEADQLTLALGDYSLEQVVQTAVSAVESLAAEKQLSLKVALPPDLPPGRGDERRITQVLLNLIGNALKFTEAGEVAVEAQALNGAFTVRVSDTGPGISEADQRSIFEEFQQAAGPSVRKQGGTGLGLAIARRIVELHSGRIWVESSPGKGSTFAFTLPIRVEQPAMMA